MTSRKGKQRRQQESQLRRAKQNSAVNTMVDAGPRLPPGAVRADASQLAHNNTYGALPQFYLDRVITCRQCGKEEVWSAERQKWWYEVAKGNINTQAVLCRACRTIEKERRSEARRIQLEGSRRKRDGRKRERTQK